MQITSYLRRAALALTTLACACGPSTSAPDRAVRGTYALVSVNGRALPADMTSDASGRVLLLSETLRLDDAGNATDESTRRDSLGSAPAQVVFASLSLSYSVSGSTVHFTVRCGFGVSCINFVPEGSLVGPNELVLQPTALTLVFEKQP